MEWVAFLVAIQGNPLVAEGRFGQSLAHVGVLYIHMMVCNTAGLECTALSGFVGTIFCCVWMILMGNYNIC